MTNKNNFGHNKPNQKFLSFEDENNGTWQEPNTIEKTLRQILIISDQKESELTKMLDNYKSVLEYTHISEKNQGREAIYKEPIKDMYIIDPKIDSSIKKELEQDLAQDYLNIYNFTDIEGIENHIYKYFI